MKAIKIFVLIVPILFLTYSCNRSENDIDELGKGFERSKMDEFFSTIETKNLGMGSISIFKNGQEDYKTAFGQADILNSIDATTDTKYRIASNSKVFTASMIMQLVEEDKLSLTTPLSTYFPEIPNAQHITIAYLLRHRSGLFNFSEKEFTEEEVVRSRTREEVLEIFIENGTIFEPNNRAQYSNTNYVLLSFIIEDIDNKTYAEALEDRITGPLNLLNTYSGGVINTAETEALSYKRENDNWVLAWQTDMSNILGTGSIVSNPKDINTFYQALFGGMVVSQEAFQEMQTLVDNFGMGMFPIPFNNKKGLGHDGRLDGFRSLVVYFPSDDVTLAYVSNGESMPMNDIIIGALSIYSGLDYKLP